MGNPAPPGSRLEEIRRVRMDKLSKLRSLGVDPYPSKYSKVLTPIASARTKLNQEVSVAGRIWRWREHGHVIFADLKDASGQVQLLLQKKILGDKFSRLKLFDVGDFMGVSGTMVTTQAGETTVDVSHFELLSKTLRPFPDQWDGLKDKETRFRRRYLDTNINPEVRDRFIRRSRFWEAHRDFFKDRGFIEINIPVLEHIPGGGDAKPFVTHMDAIDQDFYLRISQELFLKRLIGGGYEKVYEIGPRFRNEGLSDEHLPEHIAMEFYWAYADWKDGMQMIKDLFQHIQKHVYDNKKKFSIRGFDVDFSQGWQTIDFGGLIRSRYGLDVYHADFDNLKKTLTKFNIPVGKIKNIPRAVDALWKEARKSIAGPAFLINHPKFLSPLQKPSPGNPDIVERFQPIIAGSELGNGWTEVNDPVDQFKRFSEQQKMRDAGDEEAQWLDIDYVEMLEYGMPPTFGYGHSERVFWFLEDVSAREGVPFPQLRFELEEATKKIYGL
ncbi:MAG: lysyl-tRNA synthetase [Candidatus Amesbacteria bacterium GW2011_GWB1_47_19]|nr:MAG: lysyl-tRNA synthetase [Candidatus Amesbacteria bacterium GW2011_GWA1_44_24]KKU31309.1 MAG: lysyl-tRNA synthetase [Candidatus Amesbacteria bacterium GW2011_GWC1_46_24]KKU67038.1 MAG: lysyl-tRNA synthetase [Candidatus Amesbacteria bacterium GW2011_GWB1_47_19]OGD04970.1 MAG: lysine--tRNA ligase [Candidatus Amesbacteria bacterium RIFOXYB1_FULL_47_13]